MRVGILTLFHGNNNWGGDLQGYALKAYIEDNFKDTHVDLIKYRSGVNVIYKSKFEQMEQYGPSEVIKKISERIVKRKTPADGLLKKRNELFEQFQKCYLTNDHVYTDEELSELAKEYDCLICGSDQIWNPNVARPGYFLKGVEGTRKVSYAASIARDRLSDKEADAMIPLIEKFDFISVREKTAKKILDGYLKGKKSVYEVLDPALMRTREQWSEFIGTERYETEPYALMFFFSDSSAYRSRIEAYCHNHGLKLIGIPHATTYIKSDETGNYEKAYDIGPVEFLRLFRDASYVFTDSFHGSAFSIIFQRQFCVFERDKNTKTSKNSRLYDLLAKFHVSDRLVRNAEDVDDVLRKEIDYLKVNAILEKERTASGEFLKSALGHCEEKQKKKEVTVADFQKKSCCGCGLCAQICPKKCIELRQDKEGFYYPVVNQDQCIKCGRCVQKCVQTMKNNQTLTDAYIGYNPDESVRKDSSSGGIFNAIASAFIDNGGVVFGAAFDDDYSVRHVRIENKENLSRIMKSKYVQSDLKYIFDVLAEDLEKGRPVLFTGTPCQVVAVCQFADGLRLREKLYTIDFICHGVPSPGVWKSYLNYISKGSEVHEVNFRDKNHAGWHGAVKKE